VCLEGRLTPRGRMHCNDLNGQSPGTRSPRIRPPISRPARDLRRGRNSATGRGASLNVESLHIRVAEASRGISRMPSSTVTSGGSSRSPVAGTGHRRHRQVFRTGFWIRREASCDARVMQRFARITHRSERSKSIEIFVTRSDAGHNLGLPEGRTTHSRSLSMLTRSVDASCGRRPNLGFGRTRSRRHWRTNASTWRLSGARPLSNSTLDR
jgi:hypothetical protein